MKASFFALIAASMLIANIACAESPEFQTIRREVTDAIEACRTAGDKQILGDVLQRITPVVEKLTPADQSDADTLKELRAAVEQYADCI